MGKGALSVLVAVLLVCCARGSFGRRPAQMKSAAVTSTASRLRLIWLGAFICVSNISFAIGTNPGCATHVPS